MNKFYKVVFGEYEDRSVEVFDNLGDAKRFIDELLFGDSLEATIATYITLYSCEFENGRLNRGKILSQGEPRDWLQRRMTNRSEFARIKRIYASI